MPSRMLTVQINPALKEDDLSRLALETQGGFDEVKKVIDTIGMSFGYVVSVADTGNADTVFTVAHNLGVIPDGYIIVYQDKAGSVYDGGTTWTGAAIYLKADTANMSIKVMCFTDTN